MTAGLQDFIDELWNAMLPEKRSGVSTFGEFARKSRAWATEESAAKPALQLNNHLALLDEYVGWLSVLSLRARRIFESDEGLNEQFLALYGLLNRITNDCNALRVLVENGYETQARVILRAVIEHIDLTIVVCHDQSFAADFKAANTPEKSNRFWYKNVSKGRLRARVNTIIEAHLEQPGFWHEFRKEDDEMHALFSHPTLLATHVETLFNFDAKHEQLPPFVRVKSVASLRTVEYLIFHLSNLVFTCAKPMFHVHDNEPALIRTDLADTTDQLVRFGVVGLTKLFLFFLKNRDAEMFASRFDPESQALDEIEDDE